MSAKWTGQFPAYSWVLAKRPAGCPGVRVSGRLVGKSCLSVCPLYVWPYLRNESSDQLRFWHAACVPCVAVFSTAAGEARQRRVYNAIRVDSVPSCKLGPAQTRPQVPGILAGKRDRGGPNNSAPAPVWELQSALLGFSSGDNCIKVIW